MITPTDTNRPKTHEFAKPQQVGENSFESTEVNPIAVALRRQLMGQLLDGAARDQ